MRGGAPPVTVAVTAVHPPSFGPRQRQHALVRVRTLTLLATMAFRGCASFRIAAGRWSHPRRRWGRPPSVVTVVGPGAVPAFPLAALSPGSRRSFSSGARDVSMALPTSTSLNSLLSVEEDASSTGGTAKSEVLSDWCLHVLVRQTTSLEDLVEQVLQERRANNQHVKTTIQTSVTDLSAAELMDLGAVWHLPAAVRTPVLPDAPSESFIPHSSLGRKPSRVRGARQSDDGRPPHTSIVVQPGDYVRIHHRPRRFPNVHQYCWHPTGARRVSLECDPDSPDDDKAPHRRKPSVAVAYDDSAGWLVLNKPERIPVHGTVDNDLENVAACVRDALLRERRQLQQQQVHRDKDVVDDAQNNIINFGEEEEVYVSTPQRLDQNTSGLLVVATNKDFARYFAALLSAKTKHQLRHNATTTTSQYDYDTTTVRPNPSFSSTSRDAVHKRYRCLVCVAPPPSSDPEDTHWNDDGSIPPPSWSVERAVAELRQHAATGTLMRHFLEPSIRAPKNFVTRIPDDATVPDGWAECLLRVVSVGPGPCALIGSDAAQRLAQRLWRSPECIPQSAQAVVELEIDLLTGRTHQIRGQLSTAGFPLVGDAPYGGAVIVGEQVAEEGDHENHDRLALQCCELEFLDPDMVQHSNGTLSLKLSARWNRFRLDRAWWTEPLEEYRKAAVLDAESHATVPAGGAAASGSHSRSPTPSTVREPLRRELLPPRVSLSPGRHKYVLIRASSLNIDEEQRDDQKCDVEWFVKSAAPHECGGPYHGNVAQDLREWIAAAGFNATVTGGGRIYYQPDDNLATVYGFSYGFGRGDHRKAAEIIRGYGIGATVDDSPDLY